MFVPVTRNGFDELALGLPLKSIAGLHPRLFSFFVQKICGPMLQAYAFAYTSCPLPATPGPSNPITSSLPLGSTAGAGRIAPDAGSSFTTKSGATGLPWPLKRRARTFTIGQPAELSS
jgi:hypothetical protein